MNGDPQQLFKLLFSLANALPQRIPKLSLKLFLKRLDFHYFHHSRLFNFILSLHPVSPLRVIIPQCILQ